MYNTSSYALVSLPQDNMLNILRKNMSLQMFLVSSYPQDRNLKYCTPKRNTFLSLLVLLENPIIIFSKDISYNDLTCLYQNIY